MKIHLINYEQAFNNGILSKFAHKMYDELEKKKGIEVTMGNVPNPEADINHHINFLPYRHSSTINTLMVTHIAADYLDNNTVVAEEMNDKWKNYKLDSLKKSLETADLGICMSDHTKNQLIEWGVDKNKLTTILPAHDGKARRFQIVSILTNVYPDGCKREQMFTDLVETLDLKKWAFRIMGSGWHDILVPLVAKGLQVDYFADFEPETYQKILETSDYNLYFGEDEGSMGVLDAKNAGLKIIAPNVGFNVDIGVDYPFHQQYELNKIFEDLSVNPVEDWTWKNYVNQHMKLWKKLKK